MTARPLPQQWRQPIEAWEQQLRGDGFAPGTIRDRVRTVRRAAHAFAGCPWQVTAARLDAYAGQQSWSPQTRGTWLRTVRLFYEYAVTKGWTDHTPTPDRHASLVKQPAATVWHVELDSWASWLAASKQSPGTIRMRGYWLRRLACAHPQWGPWELRLDDLVSWLGAMEGAAATLRAARQSVRAFYRWGVTTGRTGIDPSAELPAIRPRRAVPRPAPEGVLAAALAEADPRERDMLELAAFVGLRRSEIARVHTRDVTRAVDGWRLRVTGKGDEIREMPLTDDLAARLLDRPAGWMFPSSHGRHLTAAYVGKIVSRRLGPDWSAHTLRHRYASAAYRAERDLRAVQTLMGHASVKTTQIYTAVPDGALRRAAVAAALIAS